MCSGGAGRQGCMCCAMALVEHVCMRAYAHTCICAYVHVLTRAYAPMCICSDAHAPPMHMLMSICFYAPMLLCSYAPMLLCSYAPMHMHGSQGTQCEPDRTPGVDCSCHSSRKPEDDPACRPTSPAGLYACMCVCACMCACMCVCMCICIHCASARSGAPACIPTRMHAYAHIPQVPLHAHLHACICTYAHVYTPGASARSRAHGTVSSLQMQSRRCCMCKRATTTMATMRCGVWCRVGSKHIHIRIISKYAYHVKSTICIYDPSRWAVRLVVWG